MKKLIILSLLFAFIFSAGIVDYKFSDLDSPPVDLIWCGTSRDTVIILTEGNSIYRSDDKGFTYKKLNDIFKNTGLEELDENENEIGKVSRIIESPVDKSLLIFLGTHGINWIGEDCGRKIKALNHGRKVQEYIFHPTEREWGMASAFTLCEDFAPGEPCRIYKELFLTKDLGNNWEQLGSYITQFSWGIVDESHIKAGVPKERILVTLEPKGRGDQKHRGWNYKVDFIYSDDFFKTKRIGLHKGNKFLLTKDFLFVAQVVDQEVQEVTLHVASATSKVYSFETIDTTNTKFREHSYTFLDTTDHSVFLHINHFGDISKWGHLYTSDSTGTKYSLSLKYNVRTTSNRCDFQKVSSMEGVYIANSIDNVYMKDEELEFEKEIMEENEMEEVPHHNSRTVRKDTFMDFVETRITFNKGGIWKRLTAPTRDVNGKKWDCSNHCYLNLHGVSSEFPQFYAVDSAAGIIIGTGNVGKYLSHVESEVSTFLSRDGGLTWFEVRKGSHIYEIGDHGAIIVIADDRNPTDTVFYSWDEGMTWQELNISNEKILIRNIIIEPSSTSQHFIAYGSKGETVGFAVGLDFTSLHEPQCRNPEEPNSSNSDYETWTPNDGTANGQCLMGRKVTYIRRKRDAECYNGLTFEKKTITENCQCTEEDFECDFGFGRNSPSEPCTSLDHSHQSTNGNLDTYTPPENCIGTFTISKGYRKIPGNSCVNGAKFDPIVISCPGSFFSTLGKVIFFFVVAIILVGLVLFVFTSDFFRNAYEFAQEKLQSNDRGVRKTEYANLELDTENNTLFDDNLGLDTGIETAIPVDSKKDKEGKKHSKKREEDTLDMLS